MPGRTIEIIIVEDMPAERERLRDQLAAEAGLHVLGMAGSGEEALALLKHRHPDVLLIDLSLPRANGWTLTREIMASNPVPIIVLCDAWRWDAAAMREESLACGAVGVLEKPASLSGPAAEEAWHKLVQMIRLMAEVKVVRRWTPGAEAAGDTGARRRRGSRAAGLLTAWRHDARVIAIGASTGGPPVLQEILAAVPRPFPLPLLIVQHITPGFLPGMANWLTETTGWPVHLARDGVMPLPGEVYLAPDDYHLGVDRALRLQLSQAEPENGLRPAVGHLFRSVAAVCGRCAIGILLSGMGRDGAAELGQLKEKGACTLAQDAASSLVHGMPGEAIRLEAASHVLSPARIAAALAELSPKQVSS